MRGRFFCGVADVRRPGLGQECRSDPARRRWRRPWGAPCRRVRPPAMPRVALFPGSFDPVTNGHVDLVRQSVRLADRLVLAIGTHPGKAPLFNAEDRLAMLEGACGPLTRTTGWEPTCTHFSDLA